MALATLNTGGKAMPIMPRSIEDVQRIANMVVSSGLFKKAKDDEPPESTLARCCLAIMTGLDVGLSPTQAIQSIAVINGRCMIYGDAVPGILWAAGFDLEQSISGEGDARTATCTITRPNGKKITRTFSVADAKRASLWDDREKVRRHGKNGPYEVANDAPWHRFPDRMLGWRALGFAKSDGASDVMRGLDIKENAIDLSRDEYSEVKIEPKQVVAVEIEDIPDAQEEAPAPQQTDAGVDQTNWHADIPDQKLLERMDADFATANDRASLGKVWACYEEAISERGFDQAAVDTYDRHVARIAARSTA